MKTTYISTFALSTATRRTVMEQQQELSVRQQELSTGRVADTGLSLGARAAQSVALRREHASLQAIIDSNALASSRLDATQGALTTLADDGRNFLGVLIDAKNNAAGASVIQLRARETLTSFVDQLNATQTGEHLFAGINTDVSPMADYFAAGSAAKQAVDDAFLAHFGFSQSDPAVATISAADMTDFLDNDFAALFDGTAWTSNWSSASSQAIKGRISSSSVVETGVTANETGMRQLAMAYTMVADLGATQLSGEAYNALLDKSTTLAGAGVQALTEAQARLGVSQQSVTRAGERMSTQMDMIEKSLNALESVDPYEVSTRVNTLLTQIEMSYAMTARIQKLTLLDYI